MNSLFLLVDPLWFVVSGAGCWPVDGLDIERWHVDAQSPGVGNGGRAEAAPR